MSEATYQRTYELVSMTPAPEGLVAMYAGGRKGETTVGRTVLALGLARVQEIEHVDGRPSRWRRGQNEPVALVLAGGGLTVAHTLNGYKGLEAKA